MQITSGSSGPWTQVTDPKICIPRYYIEWFALEMNRDHSVIFEIASSTALQTLLLTMMATPFLLRDFCP